MIRTAAIIAITVFTYAAPAQVILAESRFDDPADGRDLWLVSGDPAAGMPQHAPIDAENGCLRVAENPTGLEMRFHAPFKFLGDKRSSFGGTLSFRLSLSHGDQLYPTNDDVILRGANLVLVADAGAVPAVAPAWSTHVVPLLPESWHIGIGTGPTPSQAQLREVLANLEALEIRAEYRSAIETTWIDTVVLTGDAPCPAGDLDKDGTVGLQDLAMLLAAFGTMCP